MRVYPSIIGNLYFAPYAHFSHNKNLSNLLHPYGGPFNSPCCVIKRLGAAVQCKIEIAYPAHALGYFKWPPVDDQFNTDYFQKETEREANGIVRLAIAQKTIQANDSK